MRRVRGVSEVGLTQSPPFRTLVTRHHGQGPPLETTRGRERAMHHARKKEIATTREKRKRPLVGRAGLIYGR